MKKVMLVSNQNNPKTGFGRYFQEVEETVSSSYIIQKQQIFFFLNYPLFVKKSDAGVIHILSQNLSFILRFMSKKERRKTVVTVHDVIPLQYPLFESAQHIFLKRFDKWFFKKSIESLQYADQIICVSDATKRNLLQYIHYPESKIHVIHEYPSDEFKYLHRKKNIYDILYVGSEMPHKNVKVLIEALEHVKCKIPAIRLIKIGKPQWPGVREELLKLAYKKKILNNIIWKENVENLVEEYNSVSLLVHPSLHEGFGFPILEAMACGCPVLCSKRDSLPEIGGNAAEYFDPNDVKELADKIIKILSNSKKQEEMKKAGFLQVKKFNKKEFFKNLNHLYLEKFKEVTEQ